MESKYYTPAIEEFHVGFEYESEEDPRIRTWEKQVIDINTSLRYFRDDSDVNHRVKYLDKEDVESLGFVYDKTSKESQWKFRKNNIMLYYRPISLQLGTFTIDHMKSDFIMEYSKDNKMISLLTIKNKSELKKLLKQLRIIK